jgi:hypothetical protein
MHRRLLEAARPRLTQADVQIFNFKRHVLPKGVFDASTCHLAGGNARLRTDCNGRICICFAVGQAACCKQAVHRHIIAIPRLADPVWLPPTYGKSLYRLGAQRNQRVSREICSKSSACCICDTRQQPLRCAAGEMACARSALPHDFSGVFCWEMTHYGR